MSAPSGRPRRADVSKLFDSLQKSTAPQATSLVNSVGMKFVLIPAGTFRMGSPEGQAGARSNETPVHDIILTKPFYLGVTPVTQELYRAAMTVNPARFTVPAGGSPQHPVEQVSWHDAVAFCRTLSTMPEEHEAKRVYRLPSEAEWEYACRAGGSTVFTFGDTLAPAQANFNFRSDDAVPLERTSKVGQYPPNNFGLYDMHGNVWEWCRDWYDERAYARGETRDPQGPAEGVFRVVRGGCWRSQIATCRSAYRNALMPHNRDPYTGFRVAFQTTGE
ncbi:MAG: formylglycine-generating enzyme family protein [Planctomycetota bacterium]